MGCSASADTVRVHGGAKASAPMPTHVDVQADGNGSGSASGNDADVQAVPVKADGDGVSAAAPAPASPSPVDADALVRGGLLLLSEAARMCPLAGAPLVAQALQVCYDIFNSARTKHIWMADFMAYLREVEMELVGATRIFSNALFCQRLATQLQHTQQVLRTLTSSHAVVQAITASADEKLLKEERDKIERLKQEALFSMLNQVQADAQATANEAAQITAVLRGEAVPTPRKEEQQEEQPKHADTDAAKPAPPSGSDGADVSAPPSPPSLMTRADVMLSQSMHLSALASSLSLPNADGVLGVLRQCYDMWNAAKRRLEWQADFMVYLRALEADLVLNQRLFGESESMRQLSERLQRSHVVLGDMLKQHGCIGALRASGDRAKLRTEVADLEKIKHDAVFGMLARIQQGARATQAEVDEMRRLLAESEAELARLREENTARLQAETEDAALQSVLLPLDFSSELATETRRYMPGTRLNIVAAVGAWLGKPPEPAAAVAASSTSACAVPASDPLSSSRIFWLKGDPGVGKSCVSALLSNVYAEEVLALHLCRHDMESRRDAARLVTSVAYQLAQRLPEFKVKLLEALPAVFGETDGAGATSGLTAADLFDQLIVQPLSQIPSPVALGRRCALLIDALDESTSRGHRSELIDILSSGLQSLPSWLGVLVTSRPEEFILAKLKKYKPVNLNCESPENLADLRLYLQHRLSPAVEPSQLSAAVNVMMSKAAGLFLYARLQFAQIGLLHGDESNAQDLERDWSVAPLTPEEIATFPAGLAAFYREAMLRVKARYAAPTKQTGSSSLVLTMRLLRFILGALEPLSLSSLAECADLDDYLKVVRTLEPVRTLFPVQPPPASDTVGAAGASSRTASSAPVLSPSSIVSVYHKSVRDWYLDSDRLVDEEEAEYFVDIVAVHRRMSQRCFRRLMDAEGEEIHSQQTPPPPVLASILADHKRQLDAALGAVPLASPPPPLCVSAMDPAVRTARDPWTPPPHHSSAPLMHPSHAHALSSFSTEQLSPECALCRATIAPYSQGYKCVSCAHTECKALVQEEEAAWPKIHAELTAEGADGLQSYDCTPGNEAWIKAQHCYTVCVDCMRSVSEQAEAAHAAAAASPPPPVVALSPFLSYALRRGCAHALEGGSLLHTAVFLCHLQFLHMRLSYPGEEARLAHEFARVRDLLARHQLTMVQDGTGADGAGDGLAIDWLVGSCASASPDGVEAALRDCLSLFARFYLLRAHQLLKRPLLVYQEAMHFPTGTPVCQQAYRLLPWLQDYCTSRSEPLPLCWPSKPEQLSTQLLHMQTRHLCDMAVSEDLVVAVQSEGLALVFDLVTGSLVFRVQCANDSHFHVSILGDGRRFLVSGERSVQMVCLRDMVDEGVEAGTVLQEWTWPSDQGTIHHATLMDGDKRVLFGHTIDRVRFLTLYELELEGAQPRLLVALGDRTPELAHTSVSPNQQRCVTVDVPDGWFRVQLWDSSMELVSTLPAPRPEGRIAVRYSASVSWNKSSSLATLVLYYDVLSPSGARTSTSSLLTYRFAQADAEPELLFAHSRFTLPDTKVADIGTVEFSIDGDMLVFSAHCTLADGGGATDRVVVLDATTGVWLRTVVPSSGQLIIHTMVLSPDGLHCAIAYGWGGDNAVEIFALDGQFTQPVQRHLGNGAMVYRLAYLDEGRLLSQCNGGSLRVWDTMTRATKLTPAVVAVSAGPKSEPEPEPEPESKPEPESIPSVAAQSASAPLSPVSEAMWLSPDGRCLVTMINAEGGKRLLAVWDCHNQHALLKRLTIREADADEDEDGDEDGEDTPGVCVGWIFASELTQTSSSSSSSPPGHDLAALLCTYTDDEERRILHVYSLPMLEPLPHYTADTHVVLAHCANAGRAETIARVAIEARDPVRQAAAAAVIATSRARFVGAQNYPWLVVDSANVCGVSGCVLLGDSNATARGVHVYSPSSGRLLCHLMLPSAAHSLRWHADHQMVCVQEGFAGDVLHLFDLSSVTAPPAAAEAGAAAVPSVRAWDPLLLDPGAVFVLLDKEHLLYWSDRQIWTIAIATGRRCNVLTVPSRIRHVLVSHDRRRLYVTQLDATVLLVVTLARPVTQQPLDYSFHPQALPAQPFIPIHVLDAYV